MVGPRYRVSFFRHASLSVATMFKRSPTVILPALRAYSTEVKVPIALVAQLRKTTTVSLQKAREALSATNNDLPAALEWLKKDLEASGEAKLLKVGGRDTSQGVVSVSVLSKGASVETVGGVRAAIVELNCETDFVGRNEIFRKLAQDIAHTAAFISEANQAVSFAALQLEHLKDAPLLSATDPSAAPQGTVGSTIRDTIVKVGENITLRRASAIVEAVNANQTSPLRVASYLHGSQPEAPFCGSVGTLALLKLRSTSPIARLLAKKEFYGDLGVLERSLARQIVGFDTLSIKPSPSHEAAEQALYKQSFITFAGELNGLPVEEVLAKWSVSHELASTEADAASNGVSVEDFIKWRVGEDI